MEPANDGVDLVRGYRPALLFAALVALGIGYIAAFTYFSLHSVDFISARKARKAARLAYPANVMLGVGQGQAGSALLIKGWHAPEATSAWSRAGHAALFVPSCIDSVPVTGVRLTIRSVTAPLLHAGLRLSWTGKPEADSVETGALQDGPRTIEITPPPVQCPLAAGARGLVLRIDSARPVSPKEMGKGEDVRRLGFSLEGVELRTRTVSH